MKVTDAKIILALVDAIDTGAPVEDRLLDQYRAKALQFLAAPTEESAQLDGSTPASQAARFIAGQSMEGQIMKIHRLSHGDNGMGNVVVWFASNREAQKYLAELRREDAIDTSYPLSLDEVDIPTDKVGLLHWLNANLNTDNG